MKAIAYNIKPEEKEWLIVANYKKHDITIIANSLNVDTLAFANGKEALIIFNEDPLDKVLIDGLKSLGIKYIATSSYGIESYRPCCSSSSRFKNCQRTFSCRQRTEDHASGHQKPRQLGRW
ncbi:hypothetical protein [Pedobacter sp. UC225_65]|uniref:hypothetical protein n=1 Tax=Pedobacter sp. UC225_65 TaxID=3350173 RepID=UPI0036735136